MRFLLALAATLTGTVAPGNTLLSPQSFVCTGTGTAEGYPFGKQDTGRVQRLVTVTRGVVSVIDHKSGTNFCSTGATCASSVSSKAIALHIRDVPHHDPGYSANFRMDLRTKKFVHSGGGLDGGWSEEGKCKVVRVTE